MFDSQVLWTMLSSRALMGLRVVVVLAVVLLVLVAAALLHAPVGAHSLVVAHASQAIAAVSPQSGCIELPVTC